ncbi:MAG: aspartyl protease family protein [Myxococcota bacterium]
MTSGIVRGRGVIRERGVREGCASAFARLAFVLAATSVACASEPAPTAPAEEVVLPQAPVPGSSGAPTTDSEAEPASADSAIEAPAEDEDRADYQRDDVDRSKAVVVPFAVRDSTIPIEVTLDGPGGPAAANYLFDTGASFMTVSTAMARRIGLEIPPDAPTLEFRMATGTFTHSLVRLPALEVGATRLEKVLVSVCDTCVEERAGIDGLLGGNVIREFLVEMDYRDGNLVLLPWTTVRDNRAGDLEVMVRLSVEGTPSMLLGAVDWSVKVENMSPHPMAELRPVVEFDGGVRLVGTTIEHIPPRGVASSKVEGRAREWGTDSSPIRYTLGLEHGRWASDPSPDSKAAADPSR